jgi:parvulin-like peptidyl-prolyl isomerase
MTENSFLTVNKSSITLKQAIAYLQSSGKLSSFLGDILRQYLLEQELESDELEVQQETIEQVIVDFRKENHLLEPELFQSWLEENGINYESMYYQIEDQIKYDKLVHKVTEPRLQNEFIERKLLLDQITLSRLVVDDRELAEELKSQIQEDEASFEELVREHSIAGDRVVNGWMGAVSRGQLPDEIRSALDSAKVSDIIGPMEIAEKWYLFRVEEIQTASLANENLKQALRSDIFEQWIAEKLEAMQVQLHLSAA